MAHEVETMAYRVVPPWHGLGNNIQHDATLDEWIEQAGFNWELHEAALFASTEDGKDMYPIPGKVGLMRSDTHQVLNIVSPRYKVVQPKEVAEFFREFTELAGFQMETMGVLKGGAIYWGLAKIDDGFVLGGKKVDDRVEPYMLLATSSDGSMSTVAHLTSVRVVCMNTLQISVGTGGKNAAIRIPHSLHFNPDDVKQDLGLLPEWWAQYKAVAAAAAKVSVDRTEAVRFIADTYVPTGAELTADDAFINNYLMNDDWELSEADEENEDMVDLFRQRKLIHRTVHTMDTAPGQDLKTADGTMWGVLNGITRYWDHDFPERMPGRRLVNTWFWRGSTLKTRAYDRVKELVA